MKIARTFRFYSLEMQGKCMGFTFLFIRNVWEMHGKCMGDVWEIHGKCMGNALS